MTFYAMRPKFASLSTKVGMVFSRLPLTPNQWTLLGIVPALIAAWLLSREAWLAAAALWFTAAAIDFIDGSVARVTGRTTLFGAYLDTIVDRYTETIIVAALLFAALPNVVLPAAFWIFFYYFGSVMSTYVKAAAKEKGYVEQEIEGGLVERAEKLLILFLGMIAAHFNPKYFVYILIILGMAAHITALQRIAIARSLGKDR